MRKKIVFILATLMCVCLCACGNSGGGNSTKYSIGDSVETETTRLVLNNAELAIALNNIKDDNYLEPKEYIPEDDNDNPYVANDGAVLVYYDVNISVLGRSNFDTKNFKFASVTYNGKEYKSTDRGNSKGSDNILLLSGTEERIKGYLEIPVDIALDSEFEITFTLPNTKGTEKFTFVINAE